MFFHGCLSNMKQDDGKQGICRNFIVQLIFLFPTVKFEIFVYFLLDLE